jgi:hypothetical protein
MNKAFPLVSLSGQVLFALMTAAMYFGVVLPWGIASGTVEMIFAILIGWFLLCGLYVWIRYRQDLARERAEAADRKRDQERFYEDWQRHMRGDPAFH